MTNPADLLKQKLFPEALATPEELAIKYPPRSVAEGALVTRIAPSPTGFVHLGSLYTSLISERLAHQSQGIFILRIEDTDKKREIAGMAELFTTTLQHYHLTIDEGLGTDGQESGNYGPYTQSARIQIYQSYVKALYEQGLAYPCFATPEELETLRSHQETIGERSGYYGRFATWRTQGPEAALAALEQGLKPVMRLKSPGNFHEKIIINDLLLGRREMPENDQDIVILKTDGLPTYHFAHAVDDHLMGTTHVVRGNEWFPSLPLHLQLFAVLGWQPPQYAHLAPIQKMDEGKKRKLSKRKDQEANMEYYQQAGYPAAAVIEYLLNLANSNFEDWRRANPTADNNSFQLSWKKLANSNGPLFDLAKLNDISKELISRLDASTVFNNTLEWAKKYDQAFYQLLTDNQEYIQKILDIERSGTPKPRKDIARWAEVENEIAYFFDDNFIVPADVYQAAVTELQGANQQQIIKDFLAVYNISDNPETWFEKLKVVGEQHGFAATNQDYKANPAQYRGQVGAIAKVLRLLLTGRTQTPNLCLIMQVLGEDRIKRRLLLS